MKKIIIALCVALAVFAVGYNAYQSEKQATTGKKKVYALLPLTGFGSHVGKQQKPIIELWQKEHPDASFDIRIIDSETNPVKAISALKQALLNEKNPIVITSNSLISYNSLPVIEEKNGFAFWICTFERKDFQNPNYFRISDRSVDSMTHVANHLAKHDNIVVFYTNEDFGRNSVNIVKQMLQEQGRSISKQIDIDPAQRDIRIEALKALEEKPTAIAILGFSSLGMINLVRELRVQEYSGDIVMGTAIADPAIQQQLENSLDGLIFPDKKI